MTSFALKAALAAAFAVATAGCGSGGGPAGGEKGGAAPPAAGQGGPAAEALVAAHVAENTARLPFRMGTRHMVTGLRAEGSELVAVVTHSGNRPEGMSAEAYAEHNQALDQRSVCRDAQLAAIVRAGGTVRNEVSTAGGDNFQTRITACPDRS